MNKHFLSLYSLIALVAIACTQQQPRTFLFIGDSFTEGDGVEPDLRFTSLIGKQLQGTTTINQGRSGWTTAAFLRRWDEVESRFPESADRIFVQLGANDLRVEGHSKETIGQCRNNMEEITSRLQMIFPDSEIVLMSSVRIDEDRLIDSIRNAGFGEHSNPFLKDIGKAYQQLAQKRGYGYLDLIAHLPKDNTHDGAHLSEGGHRIVSNAILSYLEQQP